MYPCQRAALANSLALLPVSAAFLLGIAGKTYRFLNKWNKVMFLLAILGASILVTEPFWENTTVVYAQDPDQEIQLSFSNHTATVLPSSNIYAVNGRQEANVSNLINLMAKNGLDFYSLIRPNDVVLIKVNEEWAERGGTDTDILKQVIQAIYNHPQGFTGEIVVADNGQWGGGMNWADSNAEDHSQSMQKVVDSFSSSHQISTYDWRPIRATQVSEYSTDDMRDGYIVYDKADPQTGIYVSYPKFTTIYGTNISFKYGIWNGQTYENRLKVINLPVLKSHFAYGVTGAVKAYMGVQTERNSGGLANGHDSVGTGGMGTLMAETRMPTINIVCAIWVNAIPVPLAGSGPGTLYSVATRTNVLAASTDPVALDYWCSKHILVQAAQTIGYSDTHTLNPDSTNKTGVDAEALGVWLPKTRDALLRADIQATTNEQQMNIHVLSSNAPPSQTLASSPSPSQQPTEPQNPPPTLSFPAEIVYPVAAAIGVTLAMVIFRFRRKR